MESHLDYRRGRLTDQEAALEDAREMHVVALDGLVTDGQRVTSLVGDGLAVEDGTLTFLGGN